MAYIGKSPIIGNFVKLDAITAVNGQAAYTMQNGGSNFTDYESVNQFLVSLNGTIQAPTDSFTVSGSTLTFASNLSTGDVIDFVMCFGNSLSAGVPTDATVTTAKLADDAVTNAKLSFNANQYRNIIINGDMSIAQRGTSATSIDSSNDGYLTMDRWIHIQQADDSNTGKTSMTQSTTVPSGQGFANSLKIDCTTAQTSISGTNSRVVVSQRFEGQMLQYLKKGTSSAESLTCSFWVRSNKTGTYICALRDKDNSRDIAKSYTISSADTWEKKTITYEGDTTGAFDNDNARSLDIIWGLAAGSDYSSGTLQTTWGAANNANVLVGQVNLMDSTSNEWYITGVQLEVGTAASDFEFLPVDANLLRCQRYLQKFEKESSNTVLTVLQAYGSDTAIGCLPAMTKFRALPSLSTTGDFNAWTAQANNNAIGSIALYSAATTQNGFIFTRSSQGTLSAGNATGLHTQSTATVLFDAEL